MVQMLNLLVDVSPEELFRTFMEKMGVDVNNPHFVDTPKRVVRMYEELLSGYKEPNFKLTTFEAPSKPSLITVTNLSYYSLCLHHVVTFWGVAHIAYLPNKRIIGLSKFARVVKHFAARLQVQEELTEQICDFLDEKLRPKAVAVMLTGEHLCMAARGIKSPNHTTVTTAMRGYFLEDGGSLKDEFFHVIDLTTRGK